ncbi:hypothetical protein SB816_05825 [Achromobacter sp. SIMBA_011]|uniref:hypothetical protein n=1 Tax=Achromobacter sp. SIMBA_011 TaxID=3085759 RepID=UPI00397DEA31
MFRKIMTGLAFSGALAASCGAYAADVHPVTGATPGNHQSAKAPAHAGKQPQQAGAQSTKSDRQRQVQPTEQHQRKPATAAGKPHTDARK